MQIGFVESPANELASAVELMKRVKASLEHQRRYGFDTLQNNRRACSQAEGDIEEWLIEHGYLKSAA